MSLNIEPGKIMQLKNGNILLSVQIEITKLCNQKCKFCYAMCNDNVGIEMGKLRELLDEIKRAGGVRIMYTGGEPFARRDMMEILKVTKEKGFTISVNTNGTYINEKNVDEIAKYVSEIYISLHSMKPEVHDKIVGLNGSYLKILKAIELLKERKVTVAINTVATNEIASELVDMKDFCEKELGVTWSCDTRIEPTITEDRQAQVKYSLSPGSLVKINTLFYKELFSHSGICRAARKHCFIDAEGNVYPCVNFRGDSYDKTEWIENINEKKFAEIWEKNKLLNLVRNYKEKDFEKCSKCVNNQYCRKCMAHNFRETGNCILPSDERCVTEILDTVRR